MIFFDIRNSLIVITIFLDVLLGLAIFLENRRDPVNISFGIMTVLISHWSLWALLFRIFPLGAFTIFSGYWLYYAASFLPLSFLVMAMTFPPYNSFSKRWLLFFILEESVILWLVSSPGAMIKDFIFLNGEKIILWGPKYYLYILHFLLIFSAGYVILFKKLLDAKGVTKTQVRYILLGTIIPAMGAMTTNLILPWFGYYNTYTWGGQVFMIILVLFSGYAIIKHHLFNIKIIATELLTFSMWAFLLIRVLLSKSWQDVVIDGSIFGLAVFAGILLVRSVIKEVEQREKLEILTKQLEAANQELKKLDEAKSEFISIASHQLRAPLTVIKGYVSMLLEGSLGTITDLTRDSMKKVFISAEQLVRLIADMLDLSRIEGGRMKYDFKRVMLDDIVAEVVRELEQTAKAKKLTFFFENRNVAKRAVNADSDKMREVVMNLIDNALKYTSAGRVSAELYPENKDGREWLTLKVQDTGIGIKSADIGKMFTKFGRSEEARRIRADGLGLGLYVAKKIVEDHGGRVMAKSPGLGHGSSFFVQLPFTK